VHQNIVAALLSLIEKDDRPVHCLMTGSNGWPQALVQYAAALAEYCATNGRLPDSLGE